MSWFGWGSKTETPKQGKEGCKMTETVGKDGEQPKKLKPCCACPETKKLRDECIVEHGEEMCGALIEAHKNCMRSLGFDV